LKAAGKKRWGVIIAEGVERLTFLDDAWNVTKLQVRAESADRSIVEVEEKEKS